jgi:hypothetical protein
MTNHRGAQPFRAIYDPVSGNTAVVSDAGEVSITGNITASPASVGPTGAAVPADADYIGWNNGGSLQGASVANPFPVQIPGGISIGESVLEAHGSVSTAAVIYTQADTTGYYSHWFRIGGIGSSIVVVEIENPTDGTWNTQIVAPVSSAVGQTSISSNGMYFCETGGKGLRVRVSVSDGSTVTCDGVFRGFPSIVFPASQAITAAALPLPAGAATSALQTTGNAALTTINTTLGSPFQAGGSIGNTTFASTQSGTWTVGISAAQTIAVTNAGTFAVQAGQTGTWNITNISGAISLPTGAATSALQTTGNTSLSTLAGAVSGSLFQTNLADIGGTAVVTGGVNGSLGVGGLAASGASMSGNPLGNGGRAATANPTAVTDGQAVFHMLDKLGKMVVTPFAPRGLAGSQRTTITASTAETTIVTAVASTFLDLTDVTLANTGATATQVDIRDTTGGTVIWTGMVPAGDMRGITITKPWEQSSVNTNWTAQCGSSTSSLIVTAHFVKNT